jgi:putative phosphoribosyl transferase
VFFNRQNYKKNRYQRCPEAVVYFRNRTEAGHLLALNLQHYKNRPDVLVLGLPRGGVPVAYEVARELNAPLDVFIVRKLGVPGHEELGMGAIASGGVRILNDGIIRELGIPSMRSADHMPISIRQPTRKSATF